MAKGKTTASTTIARVRALVPCYSPPSDKKKIVAPKSQSTDKTIPITSTEVTRPAR
jgi:hypothetical protein